MMEQFWQQKNLHPDKILLFRMGDFYELFDQDAIIAAPILGIALTVRNKKSEDATKMCGVPHHSIAGPINKLLMAGFKVAICDQLEDPKHAKGIVKRGVTRILSPGMVYDPNEIESGKANYMASYDKETVAFFEATTGEVFYFLSASDDDKKDLLDSLRPAELVLSEEIKKIYLSSKKQVGGPFVSSYEPSGDDVNSIVKIVGEVPAAVIRLLSYAVSMQGADAIVAITKVEKRHLQKYLQMRANTVKHLEVLETYAGEKQGSLLHAIDRTKTSTGARKLRQWLLFPLLDLQSIENRQQQITFWIENFNPSTKSPGVKVIRDHLSNIGDIERRLGKICHPNANPRDILSLSQSLEEGLILAAKTKFYNYSESGIRAADQIVSLVSSAFMDEVPLHFNKEYFIKKGFQSGLDEWIDLTTNGEDKILQMEEAERAATGIASLKIRYNQVFGYYIEVTNTHKDKIPKNYIRKQTLTNAERYTTDALQELETKILSARAKRFELENAVFKDVKEKVLRSAAHLIDVAGQWAEMDVYTSLAYLATERKYVRPSLADNKKIKVTGLRHPVIEQMLKEVFVPNDIEMSSGEVFLLTGPNMAGKSTIMRQVATCQILAQMGAYVPATMAELPIIDRIFTRIGASDSLAEGLSTFMVEMVETAEIFNSITPKSLVIMDEIGRGTSTFDGMSLAQAILEEMLHKNSSYGLFATHYHELTRIAQTNVRLKNAHMSISDNGGDLKFLYKLKEGAANKSYGIHVAKLAGLPKSITERAKSILESLEKEGRSITQHKQMDLFSQDVEAVSPAWMNELKAVEVEGMTPIQALNYLVSLKDLANNDAL